MYHVDEGLCTIYTICSGIYAPYKAGLCSYVRGSTHHFEGSLYIVWRGV